MIRSPCAVGSVVFPLAVLIATFIAARGAWRFGALPAVVIGDAIFEPGIVRQGQWQPPSPRASIGRREQKTG